jgi:formate hydrogenlyase subunit 4
MNPILDLVLRLALWLLLAPLLPGIINKVKAWVAGRRGPPVLQLYYDLARLWRKGVVMSTLASPGFVAGPAVAWVALVGACLLLPLGPAGAALSFRGDVLLLDVMFDDVAHASARKAWRRNASPIRRVRRGHFPSSWMRTGKR